MRIWCKNGEQIEAHLTQTELESALAAQTISGVDVSITGETADGRYRTIKASDIQVTRTLNEAGRREHIPEDPPPLLFIEPKP